MSEAQRAYVEAHKTVVFDPGAKYPTEQKAPPPRRIPDNELRKARRGLTEAATRFLERCRRDGLIDEARLNTAVDSFEPRGPERPPVDSPPRA